MWKCLLLLTAGSGIALAGCIPVTGNRILGSDMAVADHRLSAFPATLAIGFAPPPGTKRIYSTLELQRLALANRIPLTSPEAVCFENPIHHLTRDEATSAMRLSLPAEAALKIVELENLDVPAGLLEFPVEGLEPPITVNHGVQLWRGDVKYAGARRILVWARVEVVMTFTGVVAGKDLAAGIPIDAASLRIETVTGPLEREAWAATTKAASIKDVLGRMPRRAVKAGALIPIAILADAPAVRRGDPVTVEVRSGPARLRFEAIADSAAREGEMVELRNPSNGKTFKARLEPGANALVIVAAGRRP